MVQTTKSFKQRIEAGEQILVAEGYLFELERRGYLKAGPYVPEILLEKPELVKQLHEEFVHAGSDVVVALTSPLPQVRGFDRQFSWWAGGLRSHYRSTFDLRGPLTRPASPPAKLAIKASHLLHRRSKPQEWFEYYGHRARLATVGLEQELEALQRKALEIARQVADATGTLMAGDLCNTTIYDPSDRVSWELAREIFKESVLFAVEGGADYIIGETFTDYQEAKYALEAIKEYGQGLPSVITLGQANVNSTRDGHSYADACRYLEFQGADVVGLNCSAGPGVMLTQAAELRQVCSGPIACLPVPYRTTKKQPHMHNLTMEGKSAFPDNLDGFCCTADEIASFGKKAKEIGVQYLGLCCGNSSRYFRRLAQSLGRKPPAMRFSSESSKKWVWDQMPSFTPYRHLIKSRYDKADSSAPTM